MNIIDSYDSKKSFDEYRSLRDSRVKVIFPCRMHMAPIVLTTAATILIIFLQTRLSCTAYYKAPFRVVEEEAWGICRIGLLYEYRVACRLSFHMTVPLNTVCREKHIGITTTVKNTGTSALPVADGWHPILLLAAG